jgi:small subunit ribosomal protein S17
MSKDKESLKNCLDAKVISVKMDKTAVVLIKKRIKHPIYGKFLTRISKHHVHDPENKCFLGAEVRVKESRRHSKSKKWELVSIYNEVI